MFKCSLILISLFVPSIAFANQGCIDTTEDGKKHCSEIMSPSSCKGPTSSSSSTIDGKKVIKAELAYLSRSGGYGSPKTCTGKQSGEVVKQKK